MKKEAVVLMPKELLEPKEKNVVSSEDDEEEDATNLSYKLN